MIFDLGDGPLLVLGGPYSNLRALAALRARTTALRVSASRTNCTGDVVAYCAELEETIAAMRNWGCLVVAGKDLDTGRGQHVAALTAIKDEPAVALTRHP
jgi:hypothetical protein